MIARAKAILGEAYEAAAELVVLYLEKHPGEKLQPLCKEIDPDNWNALRQKVQRAQEARKASNDAGSTRSQAAPANQIRTAKSAISRADEEQLAEIEEALRARKLHNVTDQDRRETDAVMAPLNRAVNSFSSLSIVQLIDQANEDLNAAVAGDGLTPEALGTIFESAKALIGSIEFAMQMAGVEL